jgi:hypothetical protein
MPMGMRTMDDRRSATTLVAARERANKTSFMADRTLPLEETRVNHLHGASVGRRDLDCRASPWSGERREMACDGPMHVELSSDTQVLIDLRATGLLRAVGHNPTLHACPAPWTVDVADPATIDVPIDVRFPAAAIEPPADLQTADREKMREKMCGRDVLDATRFSSIDFQGRYVGTLEGGRLSGNLRVRGAPRPIGMVLRSSTLAEETTGGARKRIDLRGAWEGRLTDLGIRPYRALLGALKLDDWIRLRLEVILSVR